MTGNTPFTIDEVAAALNCCPNNVTRKMERLCHYMDALLSHPILFNGVSRPDRLARAATAFLVAAGRLAGAEPEKFKEWVRMRATGARK